MEYTKPNVLVIGAAAVHLFYPYITPVTKVESRLDSAGLGVVGHAAVQGKASLCVISGSLLFRVPGFVASLSQQERNRQW